MSPYAAELRQWLLDPPAEGEAPIVEEHRLSDEDIGSLLPIVLGTDLAATMRLRLTIESIARDRQPRFTTRACTQMLDVLAERAARGVGDPGLITGTLLRTADWPADVAQRCGPLSDEYWHRFDKPHTLLALAAVAGRPAPRVLAAQSPLVRAERTALAQLGPPALLLVADLETLRPLPDTHARLAAFAQYQAFAVQALLDARVRAERIQSGEIAYAADKAFTEEEVRTLGRAARTILAHDRPEAAELLGAIARAVCVAPTDARTLPSQALLYEIARSIEDFPTPEALDELRSARALVRHKGVPKQLDKMIKRIERALADRPEVALRLPDLGFGPDGVKVVEIGGHKAWATADGNVTVPAAVRKAYADEVKELRGLARQAKAQVATLARVLELGLAEGVTMPMARWRAELAGHGLGRHVARRLIWESGGVAALGEHVAGDQPVRLWHPLTANAEEVAAWRERVAELRQPFKQAFRETYPLTPAEREDGRQSLRFAGHVMRNKQLYALLKGRGWQTGLLGPWDGGQVTDAQRVFGGWRITLALEFLSIEDNVELAGSGPISFERRYGPSWLPAPLEDVAPLAFSEAMRDVDLFVAVASIANDPEWTPDRFGQYWRTAGFGDLSATAQIRREALERVLPKLRIADRCTLTDRFLVVRGDRFTYKIHLGSANVLVEPGGSYLCIVQSGAATDRLHLPFADDRLDLVLSKAFLLADDARITDPTILQQLLSGRSDPRRTRGRWSSSRRPGAAVPPAAGTAATAPPGP